MGIPDEASFAVGLSAVRSTAATSVDIKDLPDAYAFVVDVPGLKSGDIKVEVEEGNRLVISGERKRGEEEGIKYLKMERRVGKLMRNFSLPENGDTDNVSAVCEDGVLTVTVKKLPPPEPKEPRTVEVQIAGDDLGGVSGLVEIILMWFFVYMFLKLYEYLF